MDAEGRKYPFKGCELRSREVIRALGQVPTNWRLPTFATGFMKRPQTLHTSVYSRAPSAPTTSADIANTHVGSGRLSCTVHNIAVQPSADAVAHVQLWYRRSKWGRLP